MRAQHVGKLEIRTKTSTADSISRCPQTNVSQNIDHQNGFQYRYPSGSCPRPARRKT